MVKVQRLFAKTNLKIPIYRVTKTIHPSADGPKTVVRYFYTHAAGENCPTNRHGRRMERSTGQQLKMIPLCDQQPFLLQLGKLHRHGGTLHAEKIRQLLTVKGNVKGEGGLPDGFGRQVGQQLFPGGGLAAPGLPGR